MVPCFCMCAYLLSCPLLFGTCLLDMKSRGRLETSRLEATSPGTPLRTAAVPNTRRLEALPSAHRAVQNAFKHLAGKVLEGVLDSPVGDWKCFQATRVGNRRGPQGSARAGRFQGFGPTTRFHIYHQWPTS